MTPTIEATPESITHLSKLLSLTQDKLLIALNGLRSISEIDPDGSSGEEIIEEAQAILKNLEG